MIVWGRRDSFRYHHTYISCWNTFLTCGGVFFQVEKEAWTHAVSPNNLGITMASEHRYRGDRGQGNSLGGRAKFGLSINSRGGIRFYRAKHNADVQVRQIGTQSVLKPRLIISSVQHSELELVCRNEIHRHVTHSPLSVRGSGNIPSRDTMSTPPAYITPILNYTEQTSSFIDKVPIGPPPPLAWIIDAKGLSLHLTF